MVECPRGTSGCIETDVELGEVDLPQAEIGPRVQCAAVTHDPGAGEQVAGVAVTETGMAADLLGHLVHLLARLEVALGIAPVDVAQVERNQSTGGIEDV